jgi:hypothetical protein
MDNFCPVNVKSKSIQNLGDFCLHTLNIPVEIPEIAIYKIIFNENQK